MAAKSINDLPIELHTSILKHLLSLSRRSSSLTPGSIDSDIHVLYLEPDPVKFESPVEFEWTENDVRSPSLFPFNVVSASKLWCNILALIPECWTRVVFDVAKDPTPLLDVFLWSKDLGNIEVIVFNSNDTQIVDKRCERSFVSAIAQALHSHTHRCKSIIFDVTNVTSLPPPMMFFIREAPYLERLALRCRVENSNSPRRQIKPGPPQDLATLFPKLRELSLTGFWFMYLVLHALRHILERWAGHELLICSCPSFNDTLLLWFTSKTKYSTSNSDDILPEIYLTNLSIVDCDHFSSRTVRELIYLCSQAEDQQRMDLYVHGKGPVLSGEDKSWFEQNADKMAVHWEIINDQGKGNVFRVTRRYE